MKFKVTEIGVSYKAPTKENIDKMADQVSKLCWERMKELYSNSDFAVNRLESELLKMKETNTAFEFILLKEIAELSHEKGYPIMGEADLSSSFIAYLLGITTFDPLLPLYREKPPKEKYSLYADMVWTSLQYPQKPDFSILIAESVHPLLEQRLNEKFRYIEDTEESTSILFVQADTACENIGRLAKLTGELPSLNQFDNEVYLPVIKNLANSFKERLGEPFTKELNSITSCDFYTLTQILGYIHGSFFQKRTIKNLYDPNFFTLRDEFFRALLSCGIPNDIAFDFVKHGVRSREAEREKYVRILEEYKVPQDLKDYFNNVANLWPASACISRLEVMCMLMWYKINYPKEFASVYQNDLEVI